jgi:hypothetical protein
MSYVGFLQREERARVNKVEIKHDPTRSEFVVFWNKLPWFIRHCSRIVIFILALTWVVQSALVNEFSWAWILLSVVLVVSFLVAKLPVEKNLARFEANRDFESFLNRFARSRVTRLYHGIFGRIFPGIVVWRMEVGPIESAWIFCKESPQAFQTACKMAKNKQEFKRLMGVR